MTARSAERLHGRVVSWSLFRHCSASRPRSAATSPQADGRPGSPQTVIVSSTLLAAAARRRVRTHSDSPVRLDGVDYTLVGVLPPADGPLERGQDFFVAAQWPPPPRKGPFFITALGRLRHVRPTPPIAPAPRRNCAAINQRLFPCGRPRTRTRRRRGA